MTARWTRAGPLAPAPPAARRLPAQRPPDADPLAEPGQQVGHHLVPVDLVEDLVPGVEVDALLHREAASAKQFRQRRHLTGVPATDRVSLS
jgi:hypothetical protein